MPNLGNSMRYGEFYFLRYFRTKNKIKEITLEQDFDHLQWSDVKKNISNRFRMDFYTGYRSAVFFWGSTELKTGSFWNQFLICSSREPRFKDLGGCLRKSEGRPIPQLQKVVSRPNFFRLPQDFFLNLSKCLKFHYLSIACVLESCAKRETKWFFFSAFTHLRPQAVDLQILTELLKCSWQHVNFQFWQLRVWGDIVPQTSV